MPGLNPFNINIIVVVKMLPAILQNISIQTSSGANRNGSGCGRIQRHLLNNGRVDFLFAVFLTDNVSIPVSESVRLRPDNNTVIWETNYY